MSTESTGPTIEDAERYLRGLVLDLPDVERVFRQAKHDLVADAVREAFEAVQAARRQMLQDAKEDLAKLPEHSKPRFWPQADAS